MFVHSLVRSEQNGERGWRAPVELGEDAPHYISYVIPLDDNGELGEEYTCEVALIAGERRTLQSMKLIKAGIDAFLLEVSRASRLWFHVRPIRKDEQRLPYVGRLHHDDFHSKLIEIEPDDISRLDQLCEEQGVFIIGCDPEQHYSKGHIKSIKPKELTS